MDGFRNLRSQMKVAMVMKTTQLRRWWSSWSKYGFGRARGGRHLMFTCLITIIFLVLIIAQELLHSRAVAGFASSEPPKQFLASSILESSRINPAVDVEREKIKDLLERTDFGKLTIREALIARRLKRSRNPTRGPESRKEFTGGAWLFPIASRLYEPYFKQFFKLTKTWVGRGRPHDFNPAAIMQDLLLTVKDPLDRNTELYTKLRASNETYTAFARQFSTNNSCSREPEATTVQKYGSCVVVGNSGILLNGTRGEEIDSHDLVIRLNNAEIYPFTKHVGKKTGLSFLNSNVFLSCAGNPGCWCHPYGSHVPIVVYICQATHLMHAAMCTGHHEAPLLITPSLLDGLCAAIVKWYSMTNFVESTGKDFSEWSTVHHADYFHYSSGMQAVMVAMGICDSVDLFGFGKFSGIKHHYHTNQQREQRLHDFEAEYLFYEDLVHGIRRVPFLQGVQFPPVRVFY